MKADICKLGRGFSPEAKLVGIWILDFQLPERGEINFCCLSPLACGGLLREPWLPDTASPTASEAMCLCHGTSLPNSVVCYAILL